MKGKKVDNFWNKISLTGCKWSNLNAWGTGTIVSHSLLGDSHLPFFSPCSFLPQSLSGVIRNWTSQYERQKSGNFLEQNQLNRLEMIQFECPGYWNHCVLFTYGWFPFPLFQPLLFSSSLTLWGNKELDLPVWRAKKWKFSEIKLSKQAVNGPIWMPQVL